MENSRLQFPKFQTFQKTTLRSSDMISMRLQPTFWSGIFIGSSSNVRLGEIRFSNPRRSEFIEDSSMKSSSWKFSAEVSDSEWHIRSVRLVHERCERAMLICAVSVSISSCDSQPGDFGIRSSDSATTKTANVSKRWRTVDHF